MNIDKHIKIVKECFSNEEVKDQAKIKGIVNFTDSFLLIELETKIKWTEQKSHGSDDDAQYYEFIGCEGVLFALKIDQEVFDKLGLDSFVFSRVDKYTHELIFKKLEENKIIKQRIDDVRKGEVISSKDLKEKLFEGENNGN